MSLSDDILKHFTKHLEVNNRLLSAMYVQQQRVQADRVPGTWRPYTVFVKNNSTSIGTQTPIQIFRDEPRRKTLSILNQGADDCLISAVPFDPVSILQQLSDPANPDTVLPAANQVVEIALLQSGSSLTIESRGGAWAWNLSSSGALLSMVENLYFLPRIIPNPTNVVPVSGIAWEGYESNGAKSLR